MAPMPESPRLYRLQAAPLLALRQVLQQQHHNLLLLCLHILRRFPVGQSQCLHVLQEKYRQLSHAVRRV